MSVEMQFTLYSDFARGLSTEWYDADYRPAKSIRRTVVSLLIVAWIAVIDLVWPRTNLSVLYVAPLLLLAWADDLKPLWRTAGLMVALTYGVYFLKNAIHDGIATASYLDYRLINRTLCAVMLIVLGRILLGWIGWRRERLDSETPEFLRKQDEEISATLALVCCAPLVALIAAIDFLAPANYNLAILYPIPLFICGWTSSQRLLWAMLAILLMLTVAAYFFGPPTVDIADELSFARNRVLAALGMIGVTIALSYWMNGHESADS